MAPNLNVRPRLDSALRCQLVSNCARPRSVTRVFVFTVEIPSFLTPSAGVSSQRFERISTFQLLSIKSEHPNKHDQLIMIAHVRDGVHQFPLTLCGGKQGKRIPGERRARGNPKRHEEILVESDERCRVVCFQSVQQSQCIAQEEHRKQGRSGQAA